MYRCIKILQSIMWVIFQIPGRCIFYIKTNKFARFIFLVFLLLFYCEFLHYYVVLLFCTWPSLTGRNIADFVANVHQRPLKAMIIADTHILGSRDGHWFDKIRREWQMERSFQTAMTIHSPDVVFILGDLLDEGKWCSQLEFQYHVNRFRRMFRTPAGVHTEVLVGNHDVGFHYMMSEQKHRRFEHAFNAPSVKMVDIRGNLFIMINSMAMEGDGCKLCSEAVNKLEDLSWQLKCAKGEAEGRTVATICDTIEKIDTYSQPIILQHFPMYRPSDSNCTVPDAAPIEERQIPFREKWDCLSRESTQQVFDWIKPRLIISAHTHHGCYRIHDDGTPEWTVASFSWRNKKNPTFLLAVISNNDFSVNQCFLPHENTVITVYVTGGLLILFSLLFPRKSTCAINKRETTENKFN